MLKPNVFIILLQWNNSTVTVECLESLRKVTYSNKRIILIDNGSTDGSLQEIRKWIEQNKEGDSIDIIPLENNRGFTGGNNVGIEFALRNNADYVLLLNNDTIVTPDFLSTLIETASQNNNIGAAGCKITYYPATSKIWFNGGRIDYFRGAFYGINKDSEGIKPSDFITGCTMLLPASVLKKVGILDERFFLGTEDIDLSYRIKDAGYKLLVNSDAVIHHKVSLTQGGRYSPTYQYYFHRNRMIFFSERLSGLKKISFFVFQFIFIIPAWIFIQLIKGRGKAIRAALQGYVDYARGKTGRYRYP